jgi:ATP-binding cassette subfamily B protein
MVQAFVTFMWGLILNSANGAIIYCGAVLVLRGELTVGGVTSFLLYMIFLIFNFIIIGFVISAVYKVFGACEKIVEMMRIAVEAGDREGLKPDEIDGSIEIRNVCFSYPTKPEV